MTLHVGSLFAGIGGFDLGLERAGMRVVWQCEIDLFCRRVLASHWPDVLRVSDVRRLRGADVERVDVLAGGFPCQDISVAGPGTGITGPKSSLWAEYARLVGELRPRYVLVENVPALRTRGFERVLTDLAACGYDAEWDGIPASAVGAPHQRDRIWIVAYPNGERRPERCRPGAVRPEQPSAQRRSQGATPLFRDVTRNWRSEPRVGRVADGVSGRVDRLGGLGNAVVPAIAEWLGRRIIAYEEGRIDAAA